MTETLVNVSDPSRVNYDACLVVDSPTATDREKIQAWSQLVTSGMCWELRGSYSIRAADLLDRRILAPSGEINWHAFEVYFGADPDAQL